RRQSDRNVGYSATAEHAHGRGGVAREEMRFELGVLTQANRKNAPERFVLRVKKDVLAELPFYFAGFQRVGDRTVERAIGFDGGAAQVAVGENGYDECPRA